MAAKECRVGGVLGEGMGLSECLRALEYPISWDLQHNADFTFIASCYSLSSPLCSDSPATFCLTSIVLSRITHDPVSLSFFIPPKQEPDG